ncbi:hypothetical protein [Clostridium sp.]|uniref:hypothetical protein n=1 Tax=Clostridium sp. TaxID=1506 RepID=UPI003217CF32
MVKCGFVGCKYNDAVLTYSKEEGYFKSNVELGNCIYGEDLILMAGKCEECDVKTLVCNNYNFDPKLCLVGGE